MFKNLFAALGLSCIIIVLLAACGSVSNASNPVHMSGSRFLQSSITIKKGESITLVNDDLVGSHVIANGTWVNNTDRTVTDAVAPSVDNVNIGGNSSITIGPLTTAGTFQLYCTVHAGMNINIVVQ